MQRPGDAANDVDVSRPMNDGDGGRRRCHHHRCERKECHVSVVLHYVGILVGI